MSTKRKPRQINEFFEEVETEEIHVGYSYSVGDALTIVVAGTFCGLKNTRQIHMWASHKRVKSFLAKQFGIGKIPCYGWLLSLLKLVKPESLGECFGRWARSLLPEQTPGATISVDGKSIASTGRMSRHKAALHVVSAQMAEYGMCIGQKASGAAGGEISAVQNLLANLQIGGCLVVADALHCQQETAKTIRKGKGDYLLNVKNNQKEMMREIADYLNDDVLREAMDKAQTTDKTSGRVEMRSVYASHDVSWMPKAREWEGLAMFGAINTRVWTPKGESGEWHFYISSRKLTARELLHRARMEWTVETMHWFLDVHFGEDFCRVENLNVQLGLNIIRKIVLNHVKRHKTNTNSNRPVSHFLMDCMLDPANIMTLVTHQYKEN